MEEFVLSLGFSNTAEIVLQNYICSAAFNPIYGSTVSELCRVGYAGLLLGAGGLGIYWTLKNRDVLEDDEELSSRKFKVLFTFIYVKFTQILQPRSS